MTAEHDGPSVVFRQLGGPREVVHGFSEEARIRGFPSPSLGGFGFVVICCGPNLPPAHPHGKLTLPLLFAAVCRIPADCNVRFGSLADLFTNSSLMSASGRKADAISPQIRVFEP